MICDQTQEIIDTLLRLKDSSNNDNNKIASIMAKPQDNRTKEEKEDLCVHVLNHLLDKNKNKNQNQNKVASVQSTNKIGEVAEFQSLLHSLK